MKLETIDIKLNNKVYTTSGIELPSIYFFIPETAQAYSTKKDYHAFVECFTNKKSYKEGRTSIAIEGLHEVVMIDKLGSKVVKELELVIPTNSPEEVDSKKKKKKITHC